MGMIINVIRRVFNSCRKRPKSVGFMRAKNAIRADRKEDVIHIHI